MRNSRRPTNVTTRPSQPGRLGARSSARGTRGLTFLEMLIAIIIVVIVIVAILQLFDKDVEVRKQQDQMAELQQNLRAAMDVISRDVRGASSCVTIPSVYKDPMDPTITIPVAVPLPIAAVWMPSEGSLASTGTLCGTEDKARPDGIAVMRCIGNGIVDIEKPGSFATGTQIQFKQSMGLQDSDVGKFLIFWPAADAITDPPVATPPYFTARIDRIDPPSSPGRQTIVKELVTIGVSIRPSGVDQAAGVDTSQSSFGLHWCPSGSWPSCTATAEFNGEIKNFDRNGIVPDGDWKAAMVEWVEYTIDKWGDNDIPHSYSSTTNEGSCLHPLLVRRVNPHFDTTAAGIVPEWDVIGQDIENLQVVWVWDPDGNPKGNRTSRTPTVDPNTGLEYQAGDPSRMASFTGGSYAGFPGESLLTIDDLSFAPQSIVYPPMPFPTNNSQPGSPTLVALRKVRITLLGRTRDRDTSIGKASTTGGPSSGIAFPEIELGETWLQGSERVGGGPPTPPLYLSGYKRRALTSELSLRNYLAGGLE